MLDLVKISGAFPELDDLRPFGDMSGQKIVFRAKHDDRPVVLKLIRRSDSTALQRVQRELDAMKRLSCDYVPVVFDYGARQIGSDKPFFIVEQFVPGGTLRQRLRSGPLDSSLVQSIALSLLKAAQHFESLSLVHRDIKPENLIIDDSDKTWVIDFGLVRLLDLTSITKTADHYGPFTPGYGAPEQMRNRKDEVDIRADLFAIGIVLYECITGSNPFLNGARDPLEVIRRVEQHNLPPLPIGVVNSGFVDLLTSMTSRFPSRRPQSAVEAAQWLTDTIYC